MKYYNTTEIRKLDAHYNFIVGERSNGKTTAILLDILKDYMETGKKGAILRRWELDIKGANSDSLFNGINNLGMIEEITEGEYTQVVHYRRAFYLVNVDEKTGKIKRSTDPFAYIFALTQATHYKSTSYPNIGTIMFDEFLCREGYLPDEVVLFLNFISTIVREKAEAKIFMVANTISWNAPYFEKFGLTNVRKMKEGSIALFTHKKKRKVGSELAMKVAVEYCANTQDYGGKDSDVYFAIDDDRVAMITDGEFEIPTYPQCPHAFSLDNVKMTYWIDYDRGVLRARLIRVDKEMFVFVEKSSEEQQRLLQGPRDCVYSLEFSSNHRHFVNPLDAYSNKATHYMCAAINGNRMFFDDNESGEEFRYYINQSSKRSVLTL